MGSNLDTAEIKGGFALDFNRKCIYSKTCFLREITKILKVVYCNTSLCSIEIFVPDEFFTRVFIEAHRRSAVAAAAVSLVPRK